MKKYTCKYKVRNFETNLKNELSEVYLLKYLSEIAIDHSESVNINFSKLSNAKMGWMINSYKAQIDEYPKLYEEFKIVTWTSKIYKFYANREFIVLNPKDEIIGKISSLWIYVDLNKRMPRRIPKEYEDYFGIIEEFNFEEFSNLEEEFTADDYKEFIVRRSDIDNNNHVNNSNYFEWMIEVVPEKIYNNYCLKMFSINYKKETVYKDQINSLIKENNVNDNEIVYNHIIRDKTSEELKCIGKTIWEKR